MPKKKNIKKILIISLILLVTVISVRNLVIEAIERANMETKVYTSVSDFKSIKEIAEYMGCTYIKQVKSSSDLFDTDIYLKFKYELYTDEVSNEEYYYRMIALMLGYLNYESIRLIDQENDIVIAIQADSQKQEITNLLINGKSNYFANQETLKSIEQYQTFDIVEIEVQSEEITNLIKNNWTTKQIDFGTKESTYNGYDIYFDEGIEIKTINKKVFNIVFTEKYQNEVVNGIKVNTSFEDIKSILGTPTFNHQNYIENKQKDIGYIGYKGKDMYIFFSENEISIYRVEAANTTTGLADAIKGFNTNADLRSFVSQITDMWPDYDSYGYDEDYVSLKYSLRGIKISFTPSEAGVYVYNNYNGYIADGTTIEEVTKNTELLPKNVNLQIDQDMVDMYEENRIMQYNNNYGNIFMGKSDYTTSKFAVNVSNNQINFVSTNREVPNSIVNKQANTFLIYSETEFIFDDKDGNIYKYDAFARNLHDLSTDSNILTVNNQKFMALKGSGIYTYGIENHVLQQILKFENEVTGLYNYDNISIIIGIKNMGIYRYNTQTNELLALVEGQDEFKITTIYEDKIFYDETLTIVK